MTTAALASNAASADAVLAALDPEQREVATALRGPVCVLAGAGTGKTRAITHRIAYGVHSGVYAPSRCSPSPSPRGPPARCGPAARRSASAGVQARTFHAAALRQLHVLLAAGRRRRAAARAASTRLRLVADAASPAAPARPTGPPCATSPPRSSGPRSACSRPRRTRRRPAARGTSTPAASTPPTVARLLEAYEEVQARPGRHRLRGRPAAHRRRPGGATGRRRGGPRAVPALRRRRVPGRQRRCSSGCSTSGSASATTSAWSATRARRSTPSPAPRPQHLLGFPRRYPGATVVRLVRDYRSTPQVVGLANALLARAAGVPTRPGTAASSVAQRPRRPAAARSRAYADELAEADAASPAGSAALVGRGTPASEIAVLFRINAQSEALEAGARRRRRPLRRARRRAVLRAPRGPRGRRCCCAARPAAGDGTASRRAGRTLVRAVLAGAGWSPQPPAGAGGASATAGSRCRRWSRWPTTSRPADARTPACADLVAELDERAAAQHAPTVEGVTLASLHAAKGLEWDAVFLVGAVRRACCRSPTPRAADAVEEERRLLYVGITRAREHLHLSWAGPATPGGRGTRSPSRFLDGLSAGRRERARGPASTAGARGPAPRQGLAYPARAAPAAAALPRRPSARSAAAPTARRRTTRTLFERAARLAARRRRPRPRCRPTSSSPTPRWWPSPRRCRGSDPTRRRSRGRARQARPLRRAGAGASDARLSTAPKVFAENPRVNSRKKPLCRRRALL